MKRALGLLSVIAVVAVLIASSSADAAHKRRRRHTTKRYDVTLTVHYGVNMIQGTINSEREECVADREVELFRDGAFIGRVTTDRYGTYQKAEAEQGDRYTASVDSYTFEDTRLVTRICEAAVARSPTP